MGTAQTGRTHGCTDQCCIRSRKSLPTRSRPHMGVKRNIMCSTLYVTHDLGACQASANEMLRVATKYDLPVYRAIGSFWLGATQAMHGALAGGLRRLEPSFEPLDSIGLFVLLPAVVMVDTLARAGRDRDALALIARVLGK